MLRPGDTFMFAGRLLRFIRLHETVVEAAEGGAGEPMVPAYAGGADAADHQPRRPGARHAAGPRDLAPVPRTGAGMAAAAEGALAPARPQRPAGGDLPARRPLVSGRLLLRGPQRAPDAGHAADPADGARGLRAARLRRHRLRARHLVGAPADRRGAAVRAGHAGRRPGSLDGGKLHAAADVPQRRGDRRADRAAPSRRGEDAEAGDGEQRPDLRRAAPPPAGPHPAARHPGRCGRRPDRSGAHRRDAARGRRAASSTWCCRASRRWRCRCCWRSAARACAATPTRRRCWPRPRRSSPRRPARPNRRRRSARRRARQATLFDQPA